MIVATATHSGDIHEAIRLYKWISKLGRNRGFDCLIVADPETPADLVMQLVTLAGESFKHIHVEVLKEHFEGWPKAANEMFKAALEFCSKLNKSMLWMEPDCVPMRIGWLKVIDSAFSDLWNHYRCMGHIYATESKQLPKLLPKYMSGVAVYPANSIVEMKFSDSKAWDMENGAWMASGSHTDVIRHFWGQPGLPPTFVAKRNEHTPINAFTLDAIHPDCVLFHRNKDGTLIDLLDRKMFPKDRPKMKVVFNVHSGDVQLAIEHSRWLLKMGMNSEHEAIIAHDMRCPMSAVNALHSNLVKCFKSVTFFVYPPPTGGYPQNANWAWQWTALEMAKQDRPWLWMEADAIALHPKWVETLQAEYVSCGCSWMGSIIPHMGHMNGGAVYPADAANRMPNSMRAVDQAWDMVSKSEIMHDCHNSANMFHLWTMLDRMPHPVGGGELPAGIRLEDISKWNVQGKVYMHRIKDNSVLRLLMDGVWEPHVRNDKLRHGGENL